MYSILFFPQVIKKKLVSKAIDLIKKLSEGEEKAVEATKKDDKKEEKKDEVRVYLSDSVR